MSSGAAVHDPTSPSAASAGAAQPVLLLTFNVPFVERAVAVAVDAAGETGAELYVCDAIPLGHASYIAQMARRFGEHHNRRELDAVARDARRRGIRTTQLVFHNPKPVVVALEVCREEKVGLLVLGADRSQLGRWSYARAVRRLRSDADFLLWVPD